MVGLLEIVLGEVAATAVTPFMDRLAGINADRQHP
jgi:hypothetical protein